MIRRPARAPTAISPRSRAGGAGTADGGNENCPGVGGVPPPGTVSGGVVPGGELFTGGTVTVFVGGVVVLVVGGVLPTGTIGWVVFGTLVVPPPPPNGKPP